jgi:hypothetical protein
MMPKYNPASSEDRRVLACQLIKMFEDSKFTKISGPDTEDVYAFNVPQVPGVRVMVMSSIKDGSIRMLGADAIRVQVMYERKDGQQKFLHVSKPVHRVGEFNEIVERTLERMRTSYAAFRAEYKNGAKCPKCSAPMFKAKSGKMCCAETCWVK